MPNAYFSRLPLKKAVDTIVSGSKRCLICITYQPDYIAEDPNYNNYDVLFTSHNKSEATKELRKAIGYAKVYNDKCKNTNIPTFEDLIEQPSNTYCVYIRYQL